jgi:hypothetical protein
MSMLVYPLTKKAKGRSGSSEQRVPALAQKLQQTVRLLGRLELAPGRNQLRTPLAYRGFLRL